MKKIDISLIIPFLNESENIEKLTSTLNNFFSNQKINAEVIFVDDGSTDDGLEKLKNSKHLFYKAKIIKFSKNYGSHAALRAGIVNSVGNWITFLYADLQDPIELISQLHKKCLEGNDIVWAVRSNTKAGFLEKMFSKFYSKLMQKFVSKNYPKNGFDVVMFNTKVASELNSHIESNSSIFLQILSFGFKQQTITYQKKAREKGKSKWTLSKKIKLLIDSFVGFSYFPLRFISLLGIIMFTVGFIWVLYIIIRAIIFHDLTPGWPSLIAILMIGFGVTNLSLGIIAEYLWRTLDASRNRKAFIIDEIFQK